MNPDDYETNVAMGLHDDYLPAYLGELALAKELGIPAIELPHQPLGLVYAARMKLAAEAAAQRMRQK